MTQGSVPVSFKGEAPVLTASCGSCARSGSRAPISWAPFLSGLTPSPPVSAVPQTCQGCSHPRAFAHAVPVASCTFSQRTRGCVPHLCWDFCPGCAYLATSSHCLLPQDQVPTRTGLCLLRAWTGRSTGAPPYISRRRNCQLRDLQHGDSLSVLICEMGCYHLLSSGSQKEW